MAKTKRKRKSPTRRARTTTAVVVAAPRAPARRRRSPSRSIARRRRRSSSGYRGGGFVATLKSRTAPLAGAAAYGWATKGDSPSAASVRGYLAMVPTLDAIGAPASHGLIATFIASKTGGMARKVFDAIGFAALMQAMHNFGSTNFDLDKTAKLAGSDEDSDLSGSIDDDEAAGYDD